MDKYLLHSSDIKHLRKDELEYEVTKLGKTPEANVDALRKQLSNLLQKQRRGSIQVTPIELDITEEDALRIEETISLISEQIEKLTTKDHKKEGHRIEIRLIHYQLRVSNWPETVEAIKIIKTRTLQIIQQFLGRLEEKSDEVNPDDHSSSESSDESEHDEQSNNGSVIELNSSSQRKSPNISKTNLLDDEDQKQLQEFKTTLHQRFNNMALSKETTQAKTPVVKRAPNITNRGYEYRPKVYKWGIKFSGESDSISVAQFLELVDIRRVSENLTYEEIFPSAADLFEKTALTWYMAHRYSFLDWMDLEIRLRSSFTHHLSKVQLWKEIINCRQREDESVIAYVSKLRILFSRLPLPVDEGLMMETVLINALPKYHDRLHFVTINSLDDLEASMLRLESTAQPVNMYNDFINEKKQQKSLVVNNNNNHTHNRSSAERSQNTRNNYNMNNKPSFYHPRQQLNYHPMQHSNYYPPRHQQPNQYYSPPQNQHYSPPQNQFNSPPRYNNNFHSNQQYRKDYRYNSATNSAQLQVPKQSNQSEQQSYHYRRGNDSRNSMSRNSNYQGNEQNQLGKARP